MAKSRRGRPPNPRPDLGLELGLPNLNPVSSWSAWAGDSRNPLVAIGRDPLAPRLDELVFMLRRDGMARAMQSLLTLPIRAAFAKGEWVAPDGSADMQEEVDFANAMWSLPANAGGMQISKNMFLEQTLLALPHGFSCFEVVKDIRKKGPLQGKVVIEKMAYRDPRTITFWAGKNGEFKGFRQIANYGVRHVNVNIDPENAWYWAANEAENPLYGVSYFESAFQHYQMKRKLYYIAHLAAQLAAVPGRVGTIPLGAQQRDVAAFRKSLSEFHFGQSIAVPAGFEVNPFDNNTGFDFKSLIEHHDTMMALSILAPFLGQENRTVMVDNSQGDASVDMYIQFMEAVTGELAESWTNKLMPQFIDYNFASGNYPQFRFGPLTDENKAAVLDLFKTIVGLQQINATPEFVRTNEITLAKRLGYPIDYDKVSEEEQQFAEEQQKAAEEAQRQLIAAQKSAAQPQGTKSAGGGTSNRVLAGKPSGAPTPQGGRPPTVKASDRQIEAANIIALALTNLLEDEDVPDDFEGPESVSE